MSINSLCNEILSLLEFQEAQLLNWGFISGSLDLRKILPQILQSPPQDTVVLELLAEQEDVAAEDILQNLATRKLVLRLNDGTYRTRFGETVRLLYLLRQRFDENDWHTARRLVSDMRLLLQRRRYPKRDISYTSLENDLHTVGINAFEHESIKLLLQDSKGSLIKLARFQVEGILKQISNLRSNNDKALVIGAGTGAGKTKAFYIPALTHIARNIDEKKQFVQALALYPRIELLKDQLAETYAESRKLDGLLISTGKRPISLGAYYGGTPESAKALKNYDGHYGWSLSDSGLGYVCPFFNCPQGDNHALVWEFDDIDDEIMANISGHYGEHARLRCQECSFQTSPSKLLLTRQQMRHCPPDILFTSTEMLNRRMGRSDEHALFGIGQPRPPRLVLLDEIHTYEGIHGAQVAYLLRRWRHARGLQGGKNVCFVGLSATLTQATEFFAKLTGIAESSVEYIYPKEDDLFEEGIEYNLVLKGDPVSGTSLLSTSVQTAMLIGRILDPVDNPISAGAYGQRIFAFTDKLDVINRWYQIMYDAEVKKRLSRLRKSEGQSGPIDNREAQGQSWVLCERLTYDLNQPLTMSRTTSQDPGVEQRTDLVIATSTLEVGYNDSRVGAVIQHKAPRSMASFLQRKGRAGRTRDMRPWTVVVTSAYGRDRWTFQHAETLYEPTIPSIDLPIKNFYVLKIQAAYCLMDWASSKLSLSGSGAGLWQVLSSNPGYLQSSRYASIRQNLSKLFTAVLKGPLRDEFEQYIRCALGNLNESELTSVLWDEPRSIYFDVLPTLIRQLESEWQTVTNSGERKWNDGVAGQPMPEFVPSALFANLNLPEVQIVLPENLLKRAHEGDNRVDLLPIHQAITEYAPGRASKRNVLAHRYDIANWIALPDEAQLSRNVINLDFLNITFDPTPISVQINGTGYLVHRPLEYRLERVPEDIRSTSFAELIWKSNFQPRRQGISEDIDDLSSHELPLRQKSSLSRFIRRIRAFTHTTRSWVDVTRLAIGVKTDIRYINGMSRRSTLFFEGTEQDTAIGFRVAADALQFELKPLDVDELMDLPHWKDLYQYLGPEFFRTKLHRDQRLHELNLSTFEIDWLWQLELSMLIATAVGRRCALPEAAIEVKDRRRDYADRTLRAIFQSQRSEGDDEQDVGRLHDQLLGHVDNPLVCSALQDAETVLWDDSEADLPNWLSETYLATLGASIFTVLTRLEPDIDPDQLIMDVDGYNIWVVESTAGGVGLIARLADLLASNPHHFELQLLDVVEHCEREQLAVNLRAVVKLLAGESSDIHHLFTDIRTKTDIAKLAEAKERLTMILEFAGIMATRQLLVALNTKFLRPNSDTDSDELIVNLIQNWEMEEQRLGTAIDIRVMAVAARRIEAIEKKIQKLMERVGGGKMVVDESQIFNLLQSMLWLSCNDSCPDCIERWQPFQKTNRPSRALLNAFIENDREVIEFQSLDWEAQVRQALQERYDIHIGCHTHEIGTLKAHIASILTSPLEIGYQHFYPTVESVSRQNELWLVQLTVHELIS